MEKAQIVKQMEGDLDQRISETIKRERPRLQNFIRKSVPNRSDAEDILQEVFYELVEAYRLMTPIEQVSAWLFRVARNRITDLFRRKPAETLSNPIADAETGDALTLEDLLPSRDTGPEAAYARRVLLEELEEALNELPDEQREVFIAHELDGRSFKEIAAETGCSVNTLLSRKHYAVLHLRRRLQAIYEEFKES
jgi:RNA polymerase sigma factor (sigma-70 family)